MGKPHVTDEEVFPNLSNRNNPNVLITGNPGTGKSLLSQEVADLCGLQYLSLAQVIQDEKLYTEWDDEMDCSIFDEDRLLEYLEEEHGYLLGQTGNVVVDFHSCEFLPEEWFDLVLVLRTDISILGKRLESRNYSETKIRENVEAEIFEVVLDEAMTTFPEALVKELSSDSVEDFQENSKFVRLYMAKWRELKRRGENAEKPSLKCGT